ncbi:MAG: oligosaccharide flippase family protein [Saprospiraceae bacterium]|nr:oligosaccharide flippase family protein [Saprospiraceae bacterium]
MKKAFISNIVFLILANLLIKPFYLFGIERKVQILVGNYDFGNYYNLFNFTLILQFINDFGIQNYTSRTISQATQDVELKARQLLQIKLGLSFIYLVLSLGIALLWYGEEVDIKFILHLCINQILISLIFFLRSNIAGLGLYFADSIFSILDRALLIIFMVGFCFVPSLQSQVSIPLFVNVQTISLLICTISAWIVLVKYKFSFKFQFLSRKRAIEILRFCLPFAMIYFATALFLKADTIWIENIFENGKEEAGRYAMCFRLYDAMTIVSLSFGGLLLAMFSKLYGDEKNLYELLQTSLTYLFIITIGLAFTGIFYAKEINQLFNKSSDTELEQIIMYLSIAFIPGSLNYIFGAFYQATHRELRLLLFYSVSAVVSILLNYLLLPELGIKASAIVFILVQSLLLVLSTVFLKSEFIHFRQRLEKIVFFTAGLLIAYSVLYFFINLPYGIEWGIIITLAMVLMNVLKIFNWKEIKKFRP